MFTPSNTKNTMKEIEQPKGDYTKLVVNFEWDIERLDSWSIFDKPDSIYSPQLSTLDDALSWRFWFKPIGDFFEEDDWCSSTVWCAGTSDDYMARVAVVDSKGFVTPYYPLVAKSDSFHTTKLPPQEDRLGQCLLLKCQILIRETMNLHGLYESGDFSDIKLCCCGREVKAHKAILAARSPVFKAMFTNNMLEAKSNIVNIDTMDTETLEEMLNFIYSAKPSIYDKLKNLTLDRKLIREKVINLLEAANFYQLDELQNICAKFLSDCTTIDEVLEVLTVAELFNLKRLKDRAMEFINKNLQEVLKSDKWTKFNEEHPNLAEMLLSAPVSESI